MAQSYNLYSRRVLLDSLYPDGDFSERSRNRNREAVRSFSRQRLFLQGSLVTAQMSEMQREPLLHATMMQETDRALTPSSHVTADLRCRAPVRASSLCTFVPIDAAVKATGMRHPPTCSPQPTRLQLSSPAKEQVHNEDVGPTPSTTDIIFHRSLSRLYSEVPIGKSGRESCSTRACTSAGTLVAISPACAGLAPLTDCIPLRASPVGTASHERGQASPEWQDGISYIQQRRVRRPWSPTSTLSYKADDESTKRALSPAQMTRRPAAKCRVVDDVSCRSFSS